MRQYEVGYRIRSILGRTKYLPPAFISFISLNDNFRNFEYTRTAAIDLQIRQHVLVFVFTFKLLLLFKYITKHIFFIVLLFEHVSSTQSHGKSGITIQSSTGLENSVFDTTSTIVSDVLLTCPTKHLTCLCTLIYQLQSSNKRISTYRHTVTLRLTKMLPQ